jgi:hypothetical protein
MKYDWAARMKARRGRIAPASFHSMRLDWTRDQAAESRAFFKSRDNSMGMMISKYIL